MKKIYCCIILLCTLPSFAQKGVKELTIGDTVPDLSFTGVLNYPSGRLKLSSLKGKLVILDFMGTSCVSCIAAFPHLQSLQKQYGRELQVIVVTRNSKEEWEKLKAKNKLVRELTLPVILNDTVLSRIFPYEYVPHEVWLNGDRVVKAVTPAEYITAANIEHLLQGNDVDWPVKRDIGDYDFTSGMITVKEPEHTSGPIYGTTLTGHRKGTLSSSRLTVDSSGNCRRLTIINASVQNLLRRTIKDHKEIYLSNNRFVWEVKERSRFVYEGSGQYEYAWQLQNTYCYEATVPLHTTTTELWQYLRHDVERYLNIKSKVQKRKINCYVLRQADDSSFKQIEALNAMTQKEHRSVADLVELLNTVSPVPVINETGLSQHMLVINTELNDIKVLNKALRKWGLELIMTERELEVFIVIEK